jgi:metal-responsive CopG/Arc/MetJ family transcriptional regulator
VEYTPHMETVQVVLDKQLLRAADRAAKQARLNRSALIREALREHLKRLQILELESRDRRGYREQPDAAGDCSSWERVAAWPEA